MTKWNLLLVWNVVLTIAIGWVFISGMWGVGKQLEQISHELKWINYSLDAGRSDIWNIDSTLRDIYRKL